MTTSRSTRMQRTNPKLRNGCRRFCVGRSDEDDSKTKSTKARSVDAVRTLVKQWEGDLLCAKICETLLKDNVKLRRSDGSGVVWNDNTALWEEHEKFQVQKTLHAVL